MKACALISGSMTHHIDHLAPICYFLNIPLLLDDEETYKVAKQFYPFIETSLSNHSLPEIGENYDLLFLTTKTAGKELKEMLALFGHHQMRFCFVPHGLSDKGSKEPDMEMYSHQDIALLYSEKQKERLTHNQVLKTIHHPIIAGNLRWHFYQKHKGWFDDAISNLLPQTNHTKILYAPTWNDFEHGTTFFDSIDKLIKSKPKEIDLLIKLHPLLEKHHTNEVIIKKLQLEEMQGVHFIETPLIYPLFDQVDIYLGDFSAISYDFLQTGKPMFFLGADNPIHAQGISLTQPEQIYENLNPTSPSFDRQDLWKTYFDPHISPALLEEELKQVVDC